MSESSSPQEPKPPVKTYVLLPHGREPRFLLLEGEGGWSLPYCESEKPFWGRVGPLIQDLRGRLGAEVTVLRQVLGQDDGSIYLMENLQPEWTPPLGRWIGRDELPDLPLAVPDHRPVLERCLTEAEQGAPPAIRNAWERPGWLAEAADWIERQLPRLGLAARGPVELYRTTSISCLVTVATDDGTLFLKAVLPIFAAEAPLTQALSEWHPGRVPHVLAVDTGRHWMLMREITGETLFHATDVRPWEETMRLVARIQIESAGRTDRLRSLGCPDRRLERVAVQIDSRFTDSTALRPDGKGLSDEEIDRLRFLAPQVKALCAELFAGPVPPTLVHGDLHIGNIMVSGDKIVIYDWTDGCVAHPFLDMLPLIGPDRRPQLPDAYPYLRATYLEPWTAFAPMDRLLRLYDQAQALAEMHQAISYHWIASNVEARDEWAPAVPDYLRGLMRRLEALSEAD